MENETAALPSFFTSFISLVFFLGMCPAGHHVPQKLCLAVAASSALRRRTGSLAPCRARPLLRDHFSSYVNTVTISNMLGFRFPLFFFLGGVVIVFSFIFSRKYDGGREHLLVMGSISHMTHRKRKWVWNWLHQHIALAHKQCTLHQALVLFREET